jgi:hypothetical protein
MHDCRKFKASVNGRIGRTARLSERLTRYVTSNPASGNAAAGSAYNVADMASLLQAVRNAGANNVVILGAWRTRATSRLGGLGKQHPHAGLAPIPTPPGYPSNLGFILFIY